MARQHQQEAPLVSGPCALYAPTVILSHWASHFLGSALIPYFLAVTLSKLPDPSHPDIGLASLSLPQAHATNPWQSPSPHQFSGNKARPSASWGASQG